MEWNILYFFTTGPVLDDLEWLEGREPTGHAWHIPCVKQLCLMHSLCQAIVLDAFLVSSNHAWCIPYVDSEAGSIQLQIQLAVSNYRSGWQSPTTDPAGSLQLQIQLAVSNYRSIKWLNRPTTISFFHLWYSMLTEEVIRLWHKDCIKHNCLM